MKWLRWLFPQPKVDYLDVIKSFVADAKHPDFDKIEARRESGGNIWINCTMQIAPGQKPVEFGPQCDEIKDDDIAVAQDKRFIYLNDGRKLEWRMPRGRR